MTLALSSRCEPLLLSGEHPVRIDRVARGVDAAPVERFAHFHDACEIVLFDRVAGHVAVEGGLHALADRTLVFIPGMALHDFAIDQGAAAWTLAQLSPFLIDAASGAPEGVVCGPMPARAFERARLVLDWLASPGPEPGSGGSAEAVRRALVTLLMSVVRDVAGTPAQAASACAPGAGADRIRAAILHLHHHPTAPFPAAEAAARCGLSEAYFSRAFRRVMGRPFSDYVTAYRLELAAHMLLATQRPVSAVAYAAGFASPSHFAVRFGERFGITPRQYRRQSLNASGRPC